MLAVLPDFLPDLGELEENSAAPEAYPVNGLYIRAWRIFSIPCDKIIVSLFPGCMSF
jgi:hypothetical protein